MSDLLGQAQGFADQALLSGTIGSGWKAGLRRASFRGATFRVTEASSEDGRRVSPHIYPLRDDIFTEDLGRAPRRWRLTGYVIGEDYFADRDALVQACTESDQPGTLVHPFLGELRVRCEGVSYRESLKEGGFATFDLTFIDAGREASPTDRLDTLRQVLSTARRVMRLARSAYAIVAAARGDLLGFAQGVAFGFVQSYVGSLSLSWLSLPRFDLSTLRTDLDALAADPVTDADQVAETLTAPFSTMGGLALLPVAPLEAGIADASRLDAEPVTEPLALLLAELDRPAPFSADVTELAALLALDGLARDAAALSAAEAAAQAIWTNAAAALAARDAVLAAIWARQDAAADAAQDELFGAWGALAAAVQSDLTDRAARLPRLGQYSLSSSLPALVLSQRLYGTAAREPELVALAGIPHPMAMAAEGPLLRP